MEKNLTTGSVFKNIVVFSLPYLLSYFLQTLYGMADLFIVGQFDGVASTTAVSIGSQVMHMLTVMIVGLAMGTTVSIAQAIGANERKKTQYSVDEKRFQTKVRSDGKDFIHRCAHCFSRRIDSDFFYHHNHYCKSARIE